MTTTLPTTYTLPMQRDVALFHDAFGMPNLIATPGPLPLDRIELRIGLIREEGVVELREAIANSDIVEIIDALVDTIYVALGALVEMGWSKAVVGNIDLRDTHLPRKPRKTSTPGINDAVLEAALRLNETYTEELERSFGAQDQNRSIELLALIVSNAQFTLAALDVDAQPFFDEVQRANMSKLGADGKPVHSRGMELDGYPEGKVLKGANYSPPDLAAIYARLYGDAPSVDATATDSDELARGVRPTA